MSGPMIDIDFKFNDSFYKKTNSQAVKRAKANTIKKTTLEAEARCKRKSPGPGNQLPGTKYVASGDLRRDHSSEISEDMGLVKEGQHYWVYVVTGTSKMPARNYPLQVVNEFVTERYMSNTFKSELRKQGVID